jgi:two-component system cell cycle sensor histidine kinase/response regulator CckA
METKLNLLLVEDSLDDAALILDHLASSGLKVSTTRVDTEAAFVAALTPDIDLICSDFSLPAFSHTRAFDLFKQSGLDLPFIVVSGTIGEMRAVECLRAGITDYVLKDHLDRLAPVIRRALAEAADRARRRNIEEQLRKSEARFRATFENAALGIALAEPSTRPIACNVALQRLLGYSEDELLSMTFRDLTHPDDLAADLAMYQELLDGKRDHYQIEKRYIRKGGQVVHTRLTASAVRAADGSLEYAIRMVEDITERKNLEAQLLRAQRLESIGTLAGGIAHDLNNVLAPILMSCQLLKLDARDDHTRKLINAIKHNAERGADLIKHILSFARGAQERRIPILARQLVREIVGIATGTFPKSIQVRADLPPDLWTVSGDPTQLHQVLLNLCVNARDAMPSGGELSITAENVELDAERAAVNPEGKAGPYVVFKVSDTGTGIPPDIRDKIFDPFFTTKEIGKGTGLGLFTALGIVKSHGGFMVLQTQPGKGTTFYIWLPAMSTHPAADTDSDEPRILPRGHGEIVLVVDDEASVRTITKQTLEAYGYSVLTAADGVDALATYARRLDDIQVVLTDTMMPLMDGTTLIYALKKLNPSVRVIAASGLSGPDQDDRARAAGARHILPKPFTADILLDCLHDVLCQD